MDGIKWVPMMPGYEDPRYTGTTQPSDRSVASTHHTHKQARAGKTFSVEFSLVTGLWLEGHKRIPSERVSEDPVSGPGVATVPGRGLI